MNVTLLAHTAISQEFLGSLVQSDDVEFLFDEDEVTDRQLVALTAIRTCYSANLPSEIVKIEGDKYFGKPATDGEGGSDAERLFRHITRSGHTSTLEHISYTFAVEGVSRSLLAQLTRHRQFSFSVQSQRYVRFGSGDKSGGFDHVVPPTVAASDKRGTVEQHGEIVETNADELFAYAMETAQAVYDALRKLGIPAEDARFVLPNAASCNLVITANLRAILEFYRKRQKGKGAQWEIADFAEHIRSAVVAVDPWTKSYFEQ